MTTLHEAVKVIADSVEKLAFEMPAPNPYTPRFVMLVIALRSALAQQGEQPRYDQAAQNRFITELRDYAEKNRGAYLFPRWDCDRALKYLTAPAAQPVDRVAVMQAIVDRDTGYKRAAAPAAQPTCKQDLPVETEQERYVRMCPDIECGRKKRCTRMVGVSCMSRADIAPAPQPDARTVVQQMVDALEQETNHALGCHVHAFSDKCTCGLDERIESVIAAGQKLLRELK